MIRKPVVAGMFYPGSADTLRDKIRELIDEGAVREDVQGIVSPHAGYMYSGHVAGAVISRVSFKDTFVIMGPNHTGLGQPFSIMSEGAWETPLGSVEIDTELASAILAASQNLSQDHVAHLEEHSIEVQLPFLQYFKPDVKLVPIILARGTGDTYKEIGNAIAEACNNAACEAVIMASSDMNHYEPHNVADEKDDRAIEAILALDEDELLNRVSEYRISMCGYGPTVAMLTACKHMGADKAELVMHQTSGDVTGDYHSVVGYAGVLIK
jgi:AmmeMemoRadiSam system protein B